MTDELDNALIPEWDELGIPEDDNAEPLDADAPHDGDDVFGED